MGSAPPGRGLLDNSEGCGESREREHGMAG
jgi:hypothetical protein